MNKNIDLKSADAIRILSIDMVTNAKSGHPGMPLGASTIIYTIFKNHLRFDPSDPLWINRDRFILSSGHASAMLYATLHLFGYQLSLDDLKKFRQIDSKTPGHPEYSPQLGIEFTTGPLGQGVSSSVGISWASLYMQKIFNKNDIKIFDNYVYVLCGDGDLMEGISYEAASFAGHNKLSNLIWIYDSNKTTIEGKTDIAFSEDVKKRFESMGWYVEKVDDGYDPEKISYAINSAIKSNLPKLIIVQTNIGYKSPKQDSNKVHGEPLSIEEVKETRKNLGWEWDEMFYVPDEIRENFKKISELKKKEKLKWEEKFKEYQKKYPSDYQKLMRYLENDFSKISFDLDTDPKTPLATREASYKILNYIADKVENLVGGSADLAPSTKTYFDKYSERNIHFGVREHAMAAISNGINVFGGLRAFCSTFLVFSDYLRPSLRLSALMNQNVIYIFTHDSIGVGEDGPTHQPIEHLMSLRLIPNLKVIRPADFYETLYAWNYIIAEKSPVALILSRQKLPILYEYKEIIKKNFNDGGYPLISYENPDSIIFATGSEVHIAIEVSKILSNENKKVNVFSIPCVEIFRKNINKYNFSSVPKFTIEAGNTFGWKDIVGSDIISFGVGEFGHSGKDVDVYRKFGLFSSNIADKMRKFL